jgi:hypothetical protein
MDPYIESQGGWPDFHNGLIAEIRRPLARALPPGYVARIEERIELIDADESRAEGFRPDVLVARGREAPAGPAPSALSVATIEPLVMEVDHPAPDEMRLTRLEIRQLPGLDLVTVIEVLSPSSKTGAGREHYLEKRRDLHARGINLVEIDLLLGGQPLPMKPRLSPGRFVAIVTRGDRLPEARVYAWSIRDALPPIPIPLRAPDPDVMLDLAPLVRAVYDDGRYGMTLRYDRPLPAGVPLHPEDRAWAESIEATPPGG